MRQQNGPSKHLHSHIVLNEANFAIGCAVDSMFARACSCELAVDSGVDDQQDACAHGGAVFHHIRQKQTS